MFWSLLTERSGRSRIAVCPAEASTLECDEGSSNPVEYSAHLSRSGFFSGKLHTHHMWYIIHTRIGCARTRFVYFSKITWPLEKEKAKTTKEHRTAQCGVHNYQHIAVSTPYSTLSSSEDSRSLYMVQRLPSDAAYSQRCGWAYVKKCNLNKQRHLVGKTDTKNSKPQAEHPSDQKKKSVIDRPRRGVRAMHRLSR